MNFYFLNKNKLSSFILLLLAFLVSCDSNDTTTSTKDKKTTDTTNTIIDSTSSKPTNGTDTVVKKEPLDTTKKYVFLTFDDGPQPGTENVMSAIKETGTKASFFMVGIHATFAPYLRNYVTEIKNGSPTFWLANHSYTHAFNDRYLSFYHHPNEAFKDFMKADSSLQIPQHIFRFPGNNAWVLDSNRNRGTKLVRPVLNMMDSIGGKVIGWDVEWHFKRNPHGSGSVPIQSAELMAQQLINTLSKNEVYRKNNIVLLAHDRMFAQQNYKDSLVKMINIVKTEHPEYIYETVEKL